MRKCLLFLICVFGFLFFVFDFCLAASIVKDTQTDFTQAGASFESTTAIVEPGSVILEISGDELLWPANGATVCAFTDYQENPQAVADGSGGAYITWQDNRNGNSDIFLKRIDPSGNTYAGWPADGLNICNDPASQANPVVALDQVGGVIVAWQDQRSVNLDIYATRITSSGTRHTSWSENGDPVCTEATSNQTSPMIVPDGTGGAIIAWTDFRGGTINIYAQKIDAGSNPSWTADGASVCSAANARSLTGLLADGAGGAYFAWQDYRNGSFWDIFLQRIANTGSLAAGSWIANGINISNQPATHQIGPRMISDGSGGVILAWHDYRSGNADIYAQRINSNGSVHASWTAGGKGICVTSASESGPRIAGDNNGGAIITYEKDQDLYAQRIDGAGAVQWITEGVTICAAADIQDYPEMVEDGLGGAIIAWHDQRNEGSTGYDVYAQRVDGNGNVSLTADGVRISSRPEGDESVSVISDNAKGAIIVWQINDTSYDIFAQRLNRVYFPSGTYTTEKIQNTDPQFLSWDTMSWTSIGIITAEVRTAASSLALDTAPWVSMSGGSEIPNPSNPWIQARFYLEPLTLGTVTSQLEDIAFEYLNETTPPVISNVKFDGSTAVSGMQISPSPSIEAVIIDAESGVNGFSIGIIIDGIISSPDTFIDNLMTYQCPTLSATSLHTIRIQAADNQGNWSTFEATNLQVVEPVIPPSVTGSYSVPNPFNPNTGSVIFYFNLPQAGDFNLLVFTPAGELVYKQFFVGQAAGAKNIAWDGKTSAGNPLPNGVYFYQLVSGGKIIGSNKIIILK